MYWLTRLESIKGLAIAIVIICGVSAVIAAIGCGDDYDCEMKKTVKKYKTPWFVALVIAILVILFTPTRKELLLIYGVGGSIDYIKSNDKAVQIPDRLVDTIINYLDEEINDEKKE